MAIQGRQRQVDYLRNRDIPSVITSEIIAKFPNPVSEGLERDQIDI